VWIELQEPRGARGLRFKVETASSCSGERKGRKASAEGTLEKIDLAKASEHQAADMKADPKNASTAA